MTEISVPLAKRVGEMTCPSFEHKKNWPRFLLSPVSRSQERFGFNELK